jgi:hypothetical protein
MAKTFEKAVTGFNHNIQHKGQVFHVQTEDSGAEIATITSHLFVGGTILASRRRTYEELRGEPEIKARVRSLMEEQHKSVLRSLVRGEFDHLIEGVRSYQPGEIDVGPRPAASRATRAAAPEEEVIELDVALDLDITLDEQAIEAWSAEVATPPVLRTSRTHVAAPQPWGRGVRSPGPAHSLPTMPRPEPPPSFLAPDQALETFFGEDLISEKTLDQVILAYLAGEASPEKK